MRYSSLLKIALGFSLILSFVAIMISRAGGQGYKPIFSDGVS
ncbi:hypothetical protein [Daejeonella sp.]